MVKKRVYIIVLMLLVLSACSSNQGGKKEQPHDVGSLEPIHVEAHILPEKPEPGIPVTIQAIVTQGKEKVLDADEVLFEIWKKGQAEHEKILGSHKGEGIYSIEKSFNDNGLYFVISHVTARHMHSMPTTAFAVGKVSEEELHEMEEVNSVGGDDGDHGDHGQDHGGNDKEHK